MDSEEKKMLQDTLELVKDNNKMLRSIRRSQKLASIMRIFYWALIIGVTVGSYYFLTPFFDKAVKVLDQSQSDFGNLKNLSGKLGL